MSKKVLKNKEQVFKNGISALLITSGILSAVGLGGFIHYNKLYNNIQKEIDDKVVGIISTEGYIAYQEEQKKYFYELYKSGEISSDEFDERVSDMSTAKYIIDNDNLPVSKMDREELSRLEEKKIAKSFAVLGSTASFVGFGTVAFAGSAAMIDKKDKEQELGMGEEL